MSFYHTTTAANAAEVAIKIKDFCVSKGWNAWQDFDLGNRWVVQGSGQPMEVFSSGDHVYFRGVNSGSPNTSAPHNSYMRLYGHTVTEMHMLAYDSPDVMFFIFKFSNGVYRQGMLGEVEKLGNWTGGTAHYLSNHVDEGHSYAGYFPSSRYGNNRMFGSYEARGGVYCDNGEGINWRPFYRGATHTGAYCAGSSGDNYNYYSASGISTRYDLTYWLWGYSQSAFNWSIHLVPFPLVIGRPDGLVSPAGHIPHFRATQSSTLTPNQVENIAGDSWRFFPMIRKGSPSSTAKKSGSYSYFYGVFMDTGMDTPIAV